MGFAQADSDASSGLTGCGPCSAWSAAGSMRAEVPLDVSRALLGDGYDSDLERAELEEGRLIAEELDALESGERLARAAAYEQSLRRCCAALGRLP